MHAATETPPADLRVSDAVELLRSLGAEADVILGSPPYLGQRSYGGLPVRESLEEWVSWMLEVSEAAVSACRGPVFWVVSGCQRDGDWIPAAEALSADWHRRGGHQLCPLVWSKNGQPGTAGRWCRRDHETVLAFKRPGLLPWSDGKAVGTPPKYGRSGGFTHRRKDDTRAKSRGEFTHPAVSMPGTVQRWTVGGGHMGHPLAHENEAPFPLGLAEFFVKGCVRPEVWWWTRSSAPGRRPTPRSCTGGGSPAGICGRARWTSAGRGWRRCESSGVRPGRCIETQHAGGFRIRPEWAGGPGAWYDAPMNAEPLPSRVAVHEAGHALVCLLQGDGVTRVTVEDDGEGNAGMAWCVFRRGHSRDARDAAVTAAGGLAEVDVFGDGEGSATDRRQEAELFARQCALDPPISEEECCETAARLLRENRAALLALARELDRRGTMTGAEVEAFVGRVW